MEINGINRDFIFEAAPAAPAAAPATAPATASANSKTRQASVISGETHKRAGAMRQSLIPGTWFLLETNMEAVIMLKELANNPDDITMKNLTTAENMPISAIELLSRSRTKTPTFLCYIKKDQDAADEVTQYIDSHPSIHYSIQVEDHLVSILSDEISTLNTYYNACMNKSKDTADYYDSLSTIDQRAKAFYYFLAKKPTNYKNKNLISAIQTCKSKAEQLSIICDKTILKELSEKGRFFIGVRKSESNRDITSLTADNFIKFGDHEDKNEHTLSKEEYLHRRECLAALNGFSGKKEGEDKGDTKRRRAEIKDKNKDVKANDAKAKTAITTAIGGKPDNAKVDIKAGLLKGGIKPYINEFNLSRATADQIGLARADTYEGLVKSWKELLVEYEKYTKKQETTNNPGLNSKFMTAKQFSSIINAGFESISNGATAGGVTPAEQYDAAWEPVFTKIKEYENKQFESIDDINEHHVMLSRLIERKQITEEQEKESQMLLKRITAVKIAQLNYRQQLMQQQATAAKSEDSQAGYKGDAARFYMNVRTLLPFGVFTEIEVSTNKRDKFSWTKKLAAVCNEVWGYEPLGEVTAVINKYSALRDLNGSVLKRAGELTDDMLSVVAPNITIGSNVGSYIKNSLMQSPGEVDPQIVKLEQGIRNLGKAIRTHSPLKKRIDQDTREADFNYKITDAPATKDAESTSKQNRDKHNMNKWLEESKLPNYLKGFIGINEDFGVALDANAVVGGTCETSEVRIPGVDFDNTDARSTMGKIVAPTPDQTPFKDGEKTSKSDSGSGDCFTAKTTKSKKNKKYTSKIPLIRVN